MKILYKHELKSNKIILLQGKNGRKLIEEKLNELGFKTCVIECYKRVLKILDNKMEVKKWRSYKIDALVATSSEILYELSNIISDKDEIEWLFKCKIFVVGKRLFKIAKKLGWKDIVVSNYANNKCFLKTIKENSLK